MRARGVAAHPISTPAPSGLLLDSGLPQPAAAYSLRRVSSTYTANKAIRVQRESGTQTDIGFDVNGNLDITALATFCTGTKGYIVTWYDQSGNGRDLTQTAVTNMYRIYDGTTVESQGANTKPSARAVTATAGMVTPAFAAYTGTDVSACLVGAISRGTTSFSPRYLSLLPTGLNDIDRQGAALIKREGSSTALEQWAINRNNADVAVVGGTFDLLQQVTAVVKGNSYSLTVDGTGTSGSASLSTFNFTKLGLGYPGSGYVSAVDQYVTELIVWFVSLSTQAQTTVASNQAIYYGTAAQGQGTTPNYLLDATGVPGPIAAYSTRRLSSTYTSNKCIQVLRDSDNTTVDIGFSDRTHSLDTAALTAFCASANGYVSKWYNQGSGGSGYDLAQATASHMWRVYTPSGNFTPTTSQATDLATAWSGFKTGYIDTSGRVIRHDQGSDVVSEGQAYALLMSVIQNDQTTFNLVRNWANSNLKRSLPASGKTTYLNCWAWHHNGSSTVLDWNLASDAEFDRYIAYEGAIARGWDTTGAIATEVTALATDLEALLLVDGNYAIQTTDEWQMSAGPNGGHHVNGSGVVSEVNVSYFRPVAYRMLKARTGHAIWEKAIDGAYYVLNKSTDNAGTLLTTVGLPPNWCYYDTGTHDVGALVSGTAGWTYSRDTNYSYDAFRALYSTYADFKYFGEARGQAFLSGALKSYFATQWTTQGHIVAELNHDGSILNNYEKNFFTAAARYALISNDAANATAATITTNRLTNILVNNGTYSFFRSDTSGTTSTYYGDAWMWFYFAIDSGAYAKTLVGYPGAGLVETQNGLPALHAIDQNRGLATSAFTAYTGTTVSGSVVGTMSSTTTSFSPRYLSLIPTGLTDIDHQGAYLIARHGALPDQTWGTNRNSVWETALGSYNQLQLVTAVISDPSYSISVDGNNATTSTNSQGTFNFTQLGVGFVGGTSYQSAQDEFISEVLVWELALTATQRTAIEANQRGWFNTATPTGGSTGGSVGADRDLSTTGWNLVFEDQFTQGYAHTWNGVAVTAGANPADWGEYGPGPGNENVGTRTPANIIVQNGECDLNVRTNQNTCAGMSNYPHTYAHGRWSVKFKQDKGQGAGPAILLWTTGTWPNDGEIDMCESPEGDCTKLHITCHIGSTNRQTGITVSTDLTQWHVLTCVWDSAFLDFYLDGTRVFHMTDISFIPTKPMWLGIQNDEGAAGHFIAAPNSSTPQPVTLHVDWVRLYQKAA